MSDHTIRNIPEQKYEVTPLELFFDLVFAFAISQLSQHLLTHLSWRGAAETLVMLVAIFAAWFTTSWSATIIRADQSRTRWLMLTVMLLGLFMNAAVTRAFTDSGWAFEESYDFSVKTIVPCCTHEGSGMGHSEKDIAKACPKATVLKGIAIHGTNASSANSNVSSWINDLHPPVSFNSFTKKDECVFARMASKIRFAKLYFDILL